MSRVHSLGVGGAGVSVRRALCPASIPQGVGAWVSGRGAMCPASVSGSVHSSGCVCVGGALLFFLGRKHKGVAS